MKTLKQLLRQPAKFVLGILLIAVALGILVACVGQYAATILTRANLDDNYSTIALLSDKYFWQKTPEGDNLRLFSLPDEIQEWIDDTLMNQTDLVESCSDTGLVSAYIPEVNIINFSRYENGYQMGDYNIGNPYRCAVLEVTLTAIGSEIKRDESNFVVDGAEQKMLNKVSVLCTGTVERVIGLEKGFKKPVGKTILITIITYNEEEIETLNLQVGEKYLVYGMNYGDTRGMELHNSILNNLPAYEELLGPALRTEIGIDYTPIKEQIDCTLTICNYSSLPWNTATFDDNGQFTGFVSYTEGRPFYYYDEEGYHIISIPTEEYIKDYGVPTIVALDGSAEDFISSSNGTLWKKMMDSINISSHGFPVLAVEKLSYQAAFSRGLARIVEGRDFVETELLNGERVCVISQVLATANDLQVGDTIELRTYGYDPNIEVQRSELMKSTAFPSAAIYSDAQGFTSEMETYTIVGLYRQEDAWQNQDDPYGFTPNTIFIPQTTVNDRVLPYSNGSYSALIIQNGKKAEFEKMQEDAGYPGLYVCMDQGYGEIVEGLDAYGKVSTNALKIGIVGCLVIVVLFLILFPLQQGKTLAIMSTLGASRGKRILHIVVSSFCLLIPGAAIGGFAGTLLWEQVAATLMESINVQIPLEADMSILAPNLTFGTFAVMTVAIFLVAVMVSGNKGLLRRK